MITFRPIGFAFALSLMASLGALNPAGADELHGNIGNLPKWGSSWMDFGQARDFSAGDTFRIALKDANAKCILVRLLGVNDDPNDRAGVVVGPSKQEIWPVGADLTVVVVLTTNYTSIKQISVHGKEPWDQTICPNNGPARIKSIDYTAGHH